jgi:hypothetical protein
MLFYVENSVKEIRRGRKRKKENERENNKKFFVI